MRYKFIFSVIILTLIAGGARGQKAAAATDEARALVRASLAAMGGEEKLRALRSVSFEGIGHTNWIEQSERPEGPYLVGYGQTKEFRDLAGGRVRATVEMRNAQFAEWTPMTTVVAGGVAALERGGQFFPNQPAQVAVAEKSLALAPERLLLTALGAPDLRLEKDAVLQSVRHRVVKFTWKDVPVTVYLNAGTGLPTAVETLENSAYEHFMSVWGDVTTRTFFSYWNLLPGGLRYPFQWDVEKIGMPLSSFTITKFAVDEPADEARFQIPEEVRRRFAALPLTKIADLPLGLANDPAKEIAPGVVKIPGRWDVAFVRQPDGVVVIEAPIGSAYSVKVLEEAKRRFPDAKVKAVITTSDAFPHLGGVREYAAQNIPIYALDVNRPILERLVAAPHRLAPDNLEKNPRRPNFRIVAGRTVIGDGPNRLELYPIRSEGGERMMMVYFPEHKMLYASDLIQKLRDGSFFMPQYLSETAAAVGRERLAVEKVFAFHSPVVPWAEVTAALEKIAGGL